MPQRDPRQSTSGSADFGIVIPGLLLVAALVTRHPMVAERVWQRLATYPDVAACRVEAQLASWPLRAWAGGLLERAEGAAWGAKATGTHDAQIAAFVKAQSLAVVGRLVLEIPSFLLLAVGGLALGRLLRTFEPPPSIDLTERLVLLDTSNLGPPTVELPELELPFPPAVASRDGWTDEDHADYDSLPELAAAAGTGCREISRTLAALPIARASRLRAVLRAEAGLSDLDLEAYRRGRLWHPRHWRLRRLRRAGISVRFMEAREALRRAGGLTPLRERLLRIAAAHASWPASIDHHGAGEGGLLEHRASVLLETLRLVRSGKVRSDDREAVLTVAVAHDAGKWISFGNEGGRWVRYDGLHAEHTADILRSLPELLDAHPDDAERIVLAVEHEYTPDALAEDFREACRRVMRPLKEVERLVVPAEEVSSTSVDVAVEEAIRVLPRVVSEMAINRMAGEWQAHGFYEGKTERGEEVLLVLESALRHQLRDYLSRPSQRALGLWRERRAGELHPGFAAMAKVMLAHGVMRSVVRDVPVTEAMPLVSLRAGKKTFRGAFPLSLAWLGTAMVGEELVHMKDGWSARGWEIAILGQGVYVQGTDAPERGDAPKPAAMRKPERSESAAVLSVAPGPVATPAPAARCPVCRREMKAIRKGRILVCVGTFDRRCDVKLRMKDGAAVMACGRCGRKLVPVRLPDRLAFMGCPDPGCKKTPPPTAGEACNEVGPDA